MPSPFPGMDPFLEEPAGWTDVHNTWINELRNYLAPQVAPHFFVRVEEYVYVTGPGDVGREMLVPDIFTVRSPQPTTSLVTPTSQLTMSPALEVDAVLEDEIHDLYLEIIDAQSQRVVTAIEVLSPANKVHGARGYEAMRAKQKTLLAGGANVMEIDLLRAGERPPSLARRSDYVVSIRQPHTLSRTAWFFDLRDTLPVVGLPLPAPVGMVLIPLQNIFDTLYDRALYAVSRDYSRPVPPPPLNPADAVWVQQRLQAWRDAQAART